MLTFRSATAQEIPALYRLGIPCFQDPERFDWGWTEEYLAYLLETEIGFLHVAELEGHSEVAGFHCGVWSYPESRENQCRFYWIYVNPQLRKQGIATKMMEFSLAEAARRGKKSAVVGIWGSDQLARKMVELLGFHTVETLTLMRLKIDGESLAAPPGRSDGKSTIPSP